jgi:hypothetical protein
MRRILFQGATSTKIVKHYNHPVVEAEVTPLIVIQDGKDVWEEDELRWGMILQCTPLKVLQERENSASLEPFELDETFSGWSNPVRWWRALQLIECIPTLDHRHIGLDLWIATSRPDPDDSFHRKIIEEIRSTLAEGHDYEEIMRRPVPMNMLELTIQLLNEGLSMHGLQHDLTDEIEAGTIRWSQALKKIEVTHPDYRRAVRAALATVVTRYQDHLVSYAAFREAPYGPDHGNKCFLMLGIEWYIYTAIERGIEVQHGMDITTMIAILSEEITSDNIQEELEKKHPLERDEPYVRPTPEERFAQVIAWYTEHFKETKRSKEELLQTLHNLHEHWEKLPISQPLVS